MRIHSDQQQPITGRATVLSCRWLMAEDSFAQVVIVQQHSYLSPAAEAVRTGKLETLVSARLEMPSAKGAQRPPLPCSGFSASLGPDQASRSSRTCSAWFNSALRCHFQPRSRGRDSRYKLFIGLETPQEQLSGFIDMSLPADPGCSFAHEAPGAAGAQSQDRKCTAVIRQPFNRPEPARANAAACLVGELASTGGCQRAVFQISDSNTSNSNPL